MKRHLAGLTTIALLLALAPRALAQTKTLTGETATMTATVEAIDAATRTVTIKGPKGNYVSVVAPESMTSERCHIGVDPKVYDRASAAPVSYAFIPAIWA